MRIPVDFDLLPGFWSMLIPEKLPHPEPSDVCIDAAQALTVIARLLGRATLLCTLYSGALPGRDRDWLQQSAPDVMQMLLEYLYPAQALTKNLVDAQAAPPPPTTGDCR